MLSAHEDGAVLQPIAVGSDDEDEVATSSATTSLTSRALGRRRPIAVAAVGLAAVAATALLLKGGPTGRTSQPWEAESFVGLTAAAPAATGQICTDGLTMEFSMSVDYSGTGTEELLKSSTGGLSLTIGSAGPPGMGLLELTVQMLSFGELKVEQAVNLTELRVVTVSKRPQSICVAYAPQSMEPGKSRTECTFKPDLMPGVGFQLLPPGTLTLANSAVAKVYDFAQTEGSVPVSFVITGSQFEKNWNDEHAWGVIKDGAKSVLTRLAGAGAMQSMNAGLANVGGDVYCQATVLTEAREGFACKAQDSIAEAVRSGAFSKAVADYIKGAGLPNISNTVSAYAAVPAKPMKCKQVNCRHAEHRGTMLEADCLGATCEKQCCESSWDMGVLPAQKPLTVKDLGIVAGDMLPPAPAPAAAPVPPGASAPAPSTPGAPVPEVDNLLAGPGSLPEKLATDTSVSKAANFTSVAGVYSDGMDLNVGMLLSLSKAAWREERVILTSAHGAMTLTAMAGDGSGHGRVKFVGGLLGGKACVVMSDKMRAGVVVPRDYTVKLYKDAEQCCIETEPVPNLGKSRKVCSKKAKGEDSFQMLPVVDLVKPEALTDIDIKNLVQISGSLTMSFSITGLSYQKLTEQCKCVAEFEQAVRESVAFTAGLDIKDSQVSVALQRGAAWAGADAKVEQANQERHPLMSKVSPRTPTKEEEKGRMIGMEKLKQLLNGTAIKEFAFDGKPDTEKEAITMNTTERAKVMLGDLEKTIVGRSDATAGPRRLAPATATGTDLVALQVTIAGCDANCAAARTKLLSPDMNALLVSRINRVTGNGVAGSATVGPMAVDHKSCPSNPSKCLFVKCPDYMANTNPLSTCYGSSCKETCCAPAACYQVKCADGLVKNPKVNPRETCSDAEECADKCCSQMCSDYDCTKHGENLCPKSGREYALVKPSKAKHKCCHRQHCCDAATSWCISCRKCMDQKSFCRSLLWKWMPKVAAAATSPRKLLDVAPTEDEQKLAELLPGAATREEIEEDERQAAKMRANTIQNLHDHKRRLSEAPEDASAPRRLSAADERIKFLEGLEEKKKQAMALLLADKASPVASKTTSGAEALRKTWGEQWDNVVLQSKAADEGNPGQIIGCAPHIEVPCGYKRSAVFLHHRGCHQYPHKVNTVAILTDTTHAVSCGNDGVCFVWKIKSGAVAQAFFPDEPDFRGRVRTVSVMDDAAFILSGGEDRNRTLGGHAFIWDWIHGVEKKSLACEDNGRFLSSAELPIWRTSLLGCSDGFAYLWAWGDGEELKLPYYRRTIDEIIDAIKGRLKKYYAQNLNGWERWAIANNIRCKSDFHDWVYTIYPGLELTDQLKEALDMFYEHHSMGEIRSIAYVPACQRFVTASSDGKIRYWDSDSGKILRIMGGGHCGSYNAIAALPSKLQAVSGGADGFGRLWDLETGAQLLAMHMPGVAAPINAVAVFPGGTKVAFGHEDGYVRIWQLDQGTPTCSIYTGSAVRGLAINPSNPMGQIITANADGYAWVFDP